MSSEEEKIIAGAAEGATRAVLSLSEEKLKALVARFLNRDVAFVQDVETINVAKEQRNTSEYDLFKRYIDDRQLCILFQMGLTLRKLERQKDRVASLRTKILNKYGSRGLHIAQLVQNGFFNKFLASCLARTPTTQQLTTEIRTFLDDIEKTAIFVREEDNVQARTIEIQVKILANSPKHFIVAGSGYAKEICAAIGEKLRDWIYRSAKDYNWEIYETQFEEVIFLSKSE